MCVNSEEIGVNCAILQDCLLNLPLDYLPLIRSHVNVTIQSARHNGMPINLEVEHS